MKKYIKPESMILSAEMQILAGMSLHNEVGDGQLANFGNLDIDDLAATPNIDVWGKDDDE